MVNFFHAIQALCVLTKIPVEDWLYESFYGDHQLGWMVSLHGTYYLVISDVNADERIMREGGGRFGWMRCHPEQGSFQGFKVFQSIPYI